MAKGVDRVRLCGTLLRPRVTLHEVPPSPVAAIRYAGLWSEVNCARLLAEPQAALAQTDVA